MYFSYSLIIGSIFMVVLKCFGNPAPFPCNGGQLCPTYLIVKVTVYITPKKNLLDPQGNAVKHAMESLGYYTKGDVRIGKVIEFDMHDFDEDALQSPREFLQELDKICRDFLCNSVIEDYRFEVGSGE